MQSDENTVDKTRVFVVHGRNEELRKSMFAFLRSIGLKPIEWSQAIQMTDETAPFIGDILDAALKQAQAVVVLLNGDDEARLRPEYHSEKMPEYEKNLTPQARPNVIFEAGLALGRFPNRTIIVEVGDLRPFSDIAGRHTIRLTNSTKARQDLAQRLSSAGCSVDLSGTDWHQIGNFETVLVEKSIKPKKLASTKDAKPDLVGNKFQTALEVLGLPKKALDIMVIISLNNTSVCSPQKIGYALRTNNDIVITLLKSLIEKNMVEVAEKSNDKDYVKYRLTKVGTDLLLDYGLI
ncbi:MAG: TIR domain-containing protein [Chloroflexota bacterium]